MVVKIQRWSPIYNCGCVIEQQVDYDDLEKRDPIVSFLMMHTVCEKHIHLASTSHSDDHEVRKAYVMSLIHETKARNIKQHDEAIKRAKFRHHRNELHKLTNHIHSHNQAIHEEFDELSDQFHCWDEHIYNQIVKEDEDR